MCREIFFEPCAVLRRPFDGFCFVGLFGDGDGDNAYFGCFILLRNKAFSGYLKSSGSSGLNNSEQHTMKMGMQHNCIGYRFISSNKTENG